MKYQVIVDSRQNLSDDELKEILDGYFPIEIYENNQTTTQPINRISILYVQSCEGMRKELYEKRKQFKEQDETRDWETTVDETFIDISNLFKLE